MANTVHFRRSLCSASDSIGFESQIHVYLEDTSHTASSTLSLAMIATANVGIVDGLLVADFHLNDDAFGQADEIVVNSLISDGPSDTVPNGSAAIQLTGMVIARRWPASGA